jgi:hypothetical protein
VNYSLFSNEDKAGDFPHVMAFVTEGFKTNYNLQVTYMKPQFDADTDFRFEIPASYKKVSTTDLIKRFQNLL